MATETAEKKTRTRKRKNYAKDWERLGFYVETILRVKAADSTDGHSERLTGQIQAYKDIADYMQNGGVK